MKGKRYKKNGNDCTREKLAIVSVILSLLNGLITLIVKLIELLDR